MVDSEQQQICIKALPEYEMKLLTALSYFLGRDINVQALACLCMYLRQSEARILGQLKYYAHQGSKRSGKMMTEYELMDLIFENPDKVNELLGNTGKVHQPTDSRDVFEVAQAGSYAEQNPERDVQS